ncbi:MAG: phytoene/squalene synthase family protein [Bryobacteraceae bacterium]
MSSSVVESYAYCVDVARRQARNFYYSFLLLPRAQREAMCAIYAFMRHCDDLSDEPDAATHTGALEEWRRQLHGVLSGADGDNPLWPAFRDAVMRFRIPHQYFDEMIDGVSSDLTARRVESFEELYRYCYQVASVVGLVIVHIFGFDDPGALVLAEKCGIAFQLTNIIRDVREDAERGRVYLPAEDLRRFGVDAGEFLRSPNGGSGFQKLMEFEASRARLYYQESAPLTRMVGKESQASLWALIAIYSKLLRRIEQSHFDVLRRRIRLHSGEKLWILAQATVRARLGV